MIDGTDQSKYIFKKINILHHVSSVEVTLEVTVALH